MSAQRPRVGSQDSGASTPTGPRRRGLKRMGSSIERGASQDTRIRGKLHRMRQAGGHQDVPMPDTEGNLTRTLHGVSNYDLHLVGVLHQRECAWFTPATFAGYTVALALTLFSTTWQAFASRCIGRRSAGGASRKTLTSALGACLFSSPVACDKARGQNCSLGPTALLRRFVCTVGLYVVFLIFFTASQVTQFQDRCAATALILSPATSNRLSNPLCLAPHPRLIYQMGASTSQSILENPLPDTVSHVR